MVGLLIGPTVFGLLLVRWDSYAAPWTAFAALAALITVVLLSTGAPIDHECQRR